MGQPLIPVMEIYLNTYNLAISFCNLSRESLERALNTKIKDLVGIQGNYSTLSLPESNLESINVVIRYLFSLWMKPQCVTIQ